MQPSFFVCKKQDFNNKGRARASRRCCTARHEEKGLSTGKAGNSWVYFVYRAIFGTATVSKIATCL